MAPRHAVGLAALILTGVAGPALAQTTLFFPGTPPLPQHAKRPELSAEVKQDLTLRPLIADGAPKLVAAGAVAAGEGFLSEPVKHGLTGVLTADVSAKGWFKGGRKLTAGSSVFGIPMGGPDGPTVVWCAPRQEPKPQPHWAAVCLPFGDASHVWVDAKPALMPAEMSWNDGVTFRSDAPKVEKKPVALPAMTFSYAFGGLDPRGWVKIDARIDWGEGPQLLRSVALPRGPDGAAVARLMGGEIALKPLAAADPKAAATAQLEVRAAPKAGEPVVY